MKNIVGLLLLGLTAFSSCTTVYFESPAPAEGTELSAFPAELHGYYTEIEAFSENESVFDEKGLRISATTAEVLTAEGAVETTFDLQKESALLQLGQYYYLNTKENEQQEHFSTFQIVADGQRLEIWAFITEADVKLPRKMRKKLKAMQTAGDYLSTDNTTAFIEELKAEGLLMKISVLERVNN
jgi:hypothetical protein